MPIGISFFTFQIIAYIVYVYKEKHQPAKSLIDFMMYVCLFPQLIAGPIVRYYDIEKEVKKRECTIPMFSEGIKRFIIGLSKKVLIANVLGEIIKELITETVLSNWLKPILFTLQIYYDFSGYSDMAIGLGLMLGFHFLENFNYPLIAKSITDFWRRWHISLSSWFRDYIYIPLGGNRVSKPKWIRNIIIVWLLTGFWHGASWNFILWGLYFVTFLLLEKFLIGKYLEKTKIVKYIYTFIIVIISFLIFNTETIPAIIESLSNMFLLNNIPFTSLETTYYLRSNIVLIIVSLIGATPLIKTIITKIKTTKLKIVIDILEPITYIVLLTIVTAFLIDASFNPFLYFRF
jgi:alginate O-acetyltransferase complex protein AlgI